MTTFWYCRDEIGRLEASRALLGADLPIKVTITKPRQNRSLEQNDMLHGIFQVIADHTGHTTEEIKEVAMYDLGYMEAKEVLGHLVETRKSTARMKTDEMSELIERVLAWAAQRGLPTKRG